MKRAALILTILLAGCSPRIIERVRTEYVTVERVDTTIVRDSVHIREQLAGDTIRITEYRDRYVYKYKAVHDTVAIHDTTAVERVITQKVEKPLTACQRAKIGLFWYLLGGFVLALLWIFRKPIIKLLKI